jgi:F0F1-type ATP synthase assembly protein I
MKCFLVYLSGEQERDGLMAKKDVKMLENLALLSQVAFIMITPIFLMVLFGRFLENRFDTGGILLLLSIALGTGAAFMNLYKLAIHKSKDGEDK